MPREPALGVAGADDDLAERQRRFAEALLDPVAAVPPGLLPAPGGPEGDRFAIYRNNLAGSLTAALAASFPTVAALVGADFFAAAAGAFIRRQPPRAAALAGYGDGFADFLAEFPPAAALPYLADSARLDWAATTALQAADAPVLTAAALAALPPAVLPDLRLDRHPAVRVVVSPWPILDIARVSRPDAGDDRVDLDQGGQSVLVTRPDLAVIFEVLTGGETAFLAALTDQPLAAAVAVAVQADGGFDLAATLARLLAVGAFAAARTGS